MPPWAATPVLPLLLLLLLVQGRGGHGAITVASLEMDMDMDMGVEAQMGSEEHQLRRAAGGRRALLPARRALLQLPRQHHRQPLLPRLRVHHPLPRRRPFL
uniref:Uncharacterized protein n=1 Tax=Aegilops tauschii subsp. strangulata TaxID=200361 RepID=A0A453DGJ7_AEGTS